MTVHFGAFTFDAARRQLTREGRPLHLTPKAFDLLALLIEEAPRVVPKAELHERLWPGTFVTDATLVGLVKELRRVLGDRNGQAPVIRTAHRVGYGFAPPLQRGRPSTAGPAHWITAGGRRFPLHEGENLIGRDPASDVWLDASSVSRRHARILIDTAGAALEDLRSKNGTVVAGVPVEGRISLRGGERIQAGSVGMVYHCSASGMSTETQMHKRPPRSTRP